MKAGISGAAWRRKIGKIVQFSRNYSFFFLVVSSGSINVWEICNAAGEFGAGTSTGGLPVGCLIFR